MLMNEQAMNAGCPFDRARIAWRQLNNICILKTRQSDEEESDKEREKAASIRNDDDEARKKRLYQEPTTSAW